MNRFLIEWIEKYLFFPSPFQRLIGILLLPFTVLYCVVTAYLRISKKPMDFGIPVVSVGNLLVGGTGKTPITIALAKQRKNVAVVLRGYKRESKGLLVVSHEGKILEDVKNSGDEAILLSQKLPNATIIVSENRSQAIQKAKELGAKIVFLDDGYRHHEIAKFDILVRPKEEPTNIMCLPSGGYRDTKMMYSFANLVLQEGKQFHRVVSFLKDEEIVESLPEKLVVVSAISKAKRLLKYLPSNTQIEIFEDHHLFTLEQIEQIKKKYPDYALITTRKDFVKLEQFNIDNLYIMELEIEFENESLKNLDKFISSFE